MKKFMHGYKELIIFYFGLICFLLCFLLGMFYLDAYWDAASFKEKGVPLEVYKWRTRAFQYVVFSPWRLTLQDTLPPYRDITLQLRSLETTVCRNLAGFEWCQTDTSWEGQKMLRRLSELAKVHPEVGNAFPPCTYLNRKGTLNVLDPQRCTSKEAAYGSYFLFPAEK